MPCAAGCRMPRLAPMSSRAFPGETDEDFEELAHYLEQSPLTHLHVFPYSDRPEPWHRDSQAGSTGV